jgi:hypothetical protein
MYAHQVVESIKNCGKDSEIAKNKKLSSLCIDILNKSQKFYLGNMKNLFSFFNGQYDTIPMFSYDLADDIRLPYKTCTLMYDSDINSENDASKAATIVIEGKDGDELLLIIWFYLSSINDWAVLPWYFSIEGILDKTKTSEMVIRPLFDDDVPNDIQEREEFITIRIAMKLVNYFLLLLNCKNISTIDNPPPEKLNKKRAKTGKCPLFTYKTLVIKPTGKKQETQAAQGLWENRVHLCRGHFKSYSDDKPLFGRYTGRYWWQPAVRGNKQKGIIMKDYEVRAA